MKGQDHSGTLYPNLCMCIQLNMMSMHIQLCMLQACMVLNVIGSLGKFTGSRMMEGFSKHHSHLIHSSHSLPVPGSSFPPTQFHHHCPQFTILHALVGPSGLQAQVGRCKPFYWCSCSELLCIAGVPFMAALQLSLLAKHAFIWQCKQDWAISPNHYNQCGYSQVRMNRIVALYAQIWVCCLAQCMLSPFPMHLHLLCIYTCTFRLHPGSIPGFLKALVILCGPEKVESGKLGI